MVQAWTPWVPTRGITGKSGATPARFRHCKCGYIASIDHSVLGPGKVKRLVDATSTPTSQETYPNATLLTFCGEQKSCPDLSFPLDSYSFSSPRWLSRAPRSSHSSASSL